jgi:hypothetical protein
MSLIIYWCPPSNGQSKTELPLQKQIRGSLTPIAIKGSDVIRLRPINRWDDSNHGHEISFDSQFFERPHQASRFDD